MLNIEDMFELMNGEKEHIKELYYLQGDSIKILKNVNCYGSVSVRYYNEDVFSFELFPKGDHSEYLNPVSLGNSVYDDFDECCEEVKSILKLNLNK
jgi:hypothetical protein